MLQSAAKTSRPALFDEISKWNLPGDVNDKGRATRADVGIGGCVDGCCRAQRRTRQRIADEIDAATILARANFINLKHPLWS